MDLEELLQPLPHKLQVKFALDCANDVKHLMTDPRSLKALEVVALWLEDKATKEEVAKAYVAAMAAEYAIYDVDYYVAIAAYYTAFVAAYTNSDIAYNAAFTAASASKALNKDTEHYKTKLLTEYLTDFELELYYG